MARNCFITSEAKRNYQGLKVLTIDVTVVGLDNQQQIRYTIDRRIKEILDTWFNSQALTPNPLDNLSKD
jgi:hypothetical protein